MRPCCGPRNQPCGVRSRHWTTRGLSACGSSLKFSRIRAECRFRQPSNASPMRDYCQMALLLEIEPDRTVHPVDIIEHIASINDWNFERQDADEISISVRGSWSDYHVSFNWMEDLESLHIASAFDLKVPEPRRAEVKQLISLINEQLWIGHFDIWNHEGVVLFRNSHLLSGGAEVTPQQCEALLRSATDSCDLYYQAFQFVVWAGKSAADALSQVMFET